VGDWVIEPLGRDHDRSGFSCGKPPLDDFIRKLVTQYEKRNLGRTFVAVSPGATRVCGYYTLAAGSVTFPDLPKVVSKKLPRHPVPVVLLGRLAVDLFCRGQGLGHRLLTDALRRAMTHAEALGIYAVEVVAIDDEAKGFYERYGFLPLLDSPLHLFLPIATIRAASGGSGS
jgi:ribosomal protein S18 acetylase RimI-like enzyme